MDLFKLTFSSDDGKTSQITLQVIIAKNIAKLSGFELIKPLPFQVLTQMPVDGLLGFFPSMLLISVFCNFISGCCMLYPIGLG